MARSFNVSPLDHPFHADRYLTMRGSPQRAGAGQIPLTPRVYAWFHTRGLGGERNAAAGVAVHTSVVGWVRL